MADLYLTHKRTSLSLLYEKKTYLTKEREYCYENGYLRNLHDKSTSGLVQICVCLTYV